MATLEQLIETQMSFSHQIRRIWVNYGEMAQPKRTVSAVQNRITTLEKLWDEYRALHKSMIAASDSKSRKDLTYFAEDIFSSIVEAVDEIRDYLAEELQKQMALSAATGPVSASASTSAAAFVSESKVALQLPPINLKRFTGDLTSWMAFRDMFLSLIYSQTDLSPIQKFHYLKTSLEGEATQTFVEIPSVSTNRVQDLRCVKDQALDIRTALLNIFRLINQWENQYIFLLLGKLDTVTRQTWTLEQKDSSAFPTYKELDPFLSHLLQALETDQPMHFSSRFQAATPEP
ncbi:hypothetical protein KM043_016465 [Ampulex compressa]|nr:hypothetical protein KM043_016465 [Ampulex compressa]